MLKPIVRKHKITFAIVVFLFFFSIIHLIKPSLIYTKKGEFRQFGIGYKNKTILPIWIFAIIFGILSYLMVLYYTMYI